MRRKEVVNAMCLCIVAFVRTEGMFKMLKEEKEEKELYGKAWDLAAELLGIYRKERKSLLTIIKELL